MAYKRPTNGNPVSKQEKLALLIEYVGYYQHVVSVEPSALNRKVPREAFAKLLDQIGEIILRESAKLARTSGPVRDFLKANPLPPGMERLLPNDIRSFCLALNAVKQWVASEQAATDRYLLGGAARTMCREAVKTCLVTGGDLGKDAELHHPIRDGRPPIFVSKRGHASIEGQNTKTADPVEGVVEPLRKAKHQSWIGLQRGCLELLGKPGAATSKRRAARDRTFAKQACDAAQLNYSQMLAWLDARADRAVGEDDLR
jgi:hypothetical protein